MFSSIDRDAGVLLKSILKALSLNAASCRLVNVSKFVVGLTHFTRNVSVICIILSASSDMFKVVDKGQFFVDSFKFSGDLASGITSSQCMECWETPLWETPCELVPQCCVNIM